MIECASRWLGWLVAVVLCSCGGNSDRQRDGPFAVDAGGELALEAADAADAGTQSRVVATESVRLKPGEERLAQCQSFKLGNEQPLFLNGALLEASQGVHHSDWFVGPEDAYPGPDATAPCEEFGIGVHAGVEGPTLRTVFSQSTQSTAESQFFGDGVAVPIPKRSQLLVSYHLLNTTREPLDVDLQATLSLLDESEVDQELALGGGLMTELSLPPLRVTRVFSDCHFAQSPSFAAYYFVPHYHGLGVGMRMELLGGSREGDVVFETHGTIGESLSRQLTPPVDLSGAEGFRFSCVYENDTHRVVSSGATGADEMCSFVLTTNAERQWYAVVADAFSEVTSIDHGINEAGEHVFELTGCVVLDLAE